MNKHFQSFAWFVTTTISGLLLLSAPARCAADDFGTWDAVSLKFLDTDKWTVSAVGQLRFRDDSSELYAYKLSPQVVYKVCSYLRLGMNYTYLPTRPASGGDFLYQHRWETEVNPRWPVNDWLTLDLRNRLEVRWLEGKSGTDERSRLRPQATFHLPHCGPLESVFINNEFFYDYNTHTYSENRLMPLGLIFRVNAHLEFTLYGMLQSVNTAGGWVSQTVLGTQLSVSF